MKTRIRPRLESLEGRTLLNAGSLDLTFGGTGLVGTPLPTSTYNGSAAVATVVQSDGKAVVVGIAVGPVSTSDGRYTLNGNHIGLVRYNVDGSLDKTFGTGGKVVLTNGIYNETVNGVAIQPDGKILVAGAFTQLNHKGSTLTTSPLSWLVARFNANGSLDTTFGGNGRVILNPNSTTVANAVSLDSLNRIVVAGAIINPATGEDFDVARLNPDGTKDTTFGSGGQVVSHVAAGQSSDTPMGVAIDSSNRIVVAGGSNTGSTLDIAMVRYTAAGALDPSFGSGGKVLTLGPGSNSAMAFSLGLQSTGKIVIDGRNSGGIYLARFNTDGTLDDGSSADTTPGDAFGNGGFYIDARVCTVKNLTIQPDDKIVAPGNGQANGTTVNDFFVTRVLADGSASDATFGQAGLTRTNSVIPVYPVWVTLAPNGAIVVTGYNTSGTPKQFTTARFLGDAPIAAHRTAHATTLAIGLETAPLTARAASPASVTATATDPTLIPLVVDDPFFLNTLAQEKRRHA